MHLGPLLTLLPRHARSWNGFAAGWTVGGLSGVAWAYLMTQVGLHACVRIGGGMRVEVEAERTGDAITTRSSMNHSPMGRD